MKTGMILLCVATAITAASCYLGVATSPDYGDYGRHDDRYRGYPEGYWNNRPNTWENHEGERVRHHRDGERGERDDD